MDRPLLRNLLVATVLALVTSTTVAKDRTGAVPPISLPTAGSVDWMLRVPVNEPVAVNGVASFDGAGTGQGSMLYPAPGAVGLLAAIVTHGVIESSLKKKQRTKIQEAADQVLVPYRETLSTIGDRDVALEALSRHPFGDRKTLAPTTDLTVPEWRIDSAPHFYLTQDQRAFVVDNAIDIYAPGSDVAAYHTVVRVVSRPRDEQDLVALWTADRGAELKKEWGYLFAESVEVALRTATPAADGQAFTTMRYLEGGSKKIERAQTLYESCGRAVLRTLRGTLMSVPLQGDVANGSSPAAPTASLCTAAPPAS